MLNSWSLKKIGASFWENRSSGVPTRSDTNRAAQLLNMARGLKFLIEKEEGMYFPSSENKGADQLCGDLICGFVFANAKIRFSQNEAHSISCL